MKIRLIYIGLLYLLSAQAAGASFCDGSKFVSLDQVLSNPVQFLNKRLQTHAILSTDGREFTRITFDEKSKFSILTTADDESTAYYKQHDLVANPPLNVVDDLFEKLRMAEGTKYKRDMSKIRYYRQNVMVCGRLVKSMGELRFAVDDMHVESSYLLPWKKVGRK
jgi:hypothetical protein